MIDLYSCAEAGTLALECPEQGQLHVMSESLLLEIVRDDGTACAVGESGRVLVTTLHNFAMPLIRYDIGDLAETGAACACGRQLPVLARVHGRAAQMLTDPQGNRYWPVLPHADLCLRIAPLRQLQYQQVGPDRVDMYYTMERELTSEEVTQLIAQLHRVVAYPFTYSFVHSHGSLRSPAGKFAPLSTAITGTAKN